MYNDGGNFRFAQIPPKKEIFSYLYKFYFFIEYFYQIFYSSTTFTKFYFFLDYFCRGDSYGRPGRRKACPYMRIFLSLYVVAIHFYYLETVTLLTVFLHFGGI
jgi:hypothetical protein